MVDLLDAITFGHELFDAIADGTDVPPSNTLSRKRYYSRLSRLVKTDLVERKNGKYIQTLFGEVIYGIQLGFATVIEDHLKLTPGIGQKHPIKQRDAIVSTVVKN